MMAEAVLARQMPTRTDEKPTGIFQRAAAADQHTFGDLPPSVQEVVRSGGQALDPGLRARMESHFGRDFSQVRVHTDARVAPGGDRGAKVVQPGPWRGNPVIEDGNQNEGWVHIEGRHITGNHPDGPR